MSDEFNVFISWSGDRSRWAAEALRDWLPLVVQSVKPWMSDTDIEKGARGFEEIDKRLAGMRLGIVCLTPENLNAPWILYEAGALSKSVGEKTRLWTYLLGGLRPQEVAPPLSMFQGTVADGSDTRKLLGAINRAVSASPLQDATIDHLFEKMWPELEARLADMPRAEKDAGPKRSADDMIAEILDIARAGANDREQLHEQLEHVEGILDPGPFGGTLFRTAAPRWRAGNWREDLTSLSTLRGAPARPQSASRREPLLAQPVGEAEPASGEASAEPERGSGE